MKGNFIINDKTSNFMKLSLSAYYKLDTITLGVYCKLLGLGENWEMIPKALPSVLNLSKDKTIASIKTLEREGFLQRVAAKDVHGKFVGYIYRLNAEPAPAEERTRAGLGYVNSGLPENGVVQKPSTPKTGNPENPQPNNIENNNKYKDFNKNNKENNKDNKESNDSSIATAKRKSSIDYEEFKDFYNMTMEQAGAVIPKIKDVTPKRKGMINARVKEYGMDAVREVVRKAAASIFMNGGGGRAWKATFDWIFSPNNFVKILENNYNDNKENNNGRADIGLAGKTANERAETLQERIRRENDDFLNGKGEDRGLPESIF
jgi:hypothetical protein